MDDEKVYCIEWQEPGKWRRAYALLTGFELDRLLSYFENLAIVNIVEPHDKVVYNGFEHLAKAHNWEIY